MKAKCEYLKAIRRKIAEENNIPLDIPDCTYQGHCPGTCPKCESEVRYLEAELEKRLSLGKAAVVAGIALGISAPAAAQSDSIVHPKTIPEVVVSDNRPELCEVYLVGAVASTRKIVYCLHGVVTDEQGNPVAGASVEVLDKGELFLEHVCTQDNGEFFWASDKKKACMMVVSKEGYQVLKIKVRSRSYRLRYFLSRYTPFNPRYPKVKVVLKEEPYQLEGDVPAITEPQNRIINP